MDEATKKYLDDQHDLIFEEIKDLKYQIEPITKIYNSFNGFSTVASWFFKLFVIPFSVIVGIWYEITKTHH